MKKVKPAISVIEVVANNNYGHPTKKTLNVLQSTGSKIYRTDTNGNIVVATNGQSYAVSTEKQSWNTAGVVPQTTAHTFAGTAGRVAFVSIASQQQFVGSVKSDKYHYPSCQWAQKIKPENEIWFTSSEDALARGYVSCGVCHPP